MEVTPSDFVPPEPPPGLSSQVVGASSLQRASRPDALAQKVGKPRDSKAVRPRESLREIEFNAIFTDKKFYKIFIP